MSGPTGPGGFQGIQGPTGSAGPIGLTGMRGMQGPAGVTGPAGGVGIAGSTGIQLPNNGTLAQCASIRNTQIIASSQDFTTPIDFGVRNPGLTGSNSTSLSGQYDLSGLNYYSSPLSFQGSNILVPGDGKYYISSVVETNNIWNNLGPTPFFSISLDSFDGTNYSQIVPGTAGKPGTPCYLYHYYTPAVDTRVSVRLRMFDASDSFNEIPIGAFTDVSTNFPNGILSIVKIW